MAVLLFKQFLLCKDTQLCGGDFHKELVAAVAVPAGAGSIYYIFACIYEITQASNMRSIAMVYGLYNLYILIHGYPKIWLVLFRITGISWIELSQFLEVGLKG